MGMIATVSAFLTFFVVLFRMWAAVLANDRRFGMFGMKEITVLTGAGQKAHEVAGEMAEKVKAVIYEYSGQVPLATAIGVLEIVKKEILDES